MIRTNKRLCTVRGFTLAETLITLGIIGVVAALTLPSLIQNYKKKLVETKLKETYSILSQMMQSSIAENGESINWKYAKMGDDSYTEDTFFQTYLAEHVKLAYTCPKRTSFDQKEYNKGICRNHNTDEFITQDGAKVNWSNMTENSKKYVLPNGTSFYIETRWGIPASSIQDDGYSNYIIFVVDLNINNNKALFGRDIFLFHYMEKTETMQSSRYMNFKSGNWWHDLSCRGLDRERAIDDCKKGSLGTAGGGYDAGCTTLIMCNGFLIPDDYPIKF